MVNHHVFLPSEIFSLLEQKKTKAKRDIAGVVIKLKGRDNKTLFQKYCSDFFLLLVKICCITMLEIIAAYESFTRLFLRQPINNGGGLA